ncbi:MAG: peptide deformylase [Phycisphaerales bacterium]
MAIDPAKLEIVNYPASVLRQRAKPVPKVTDEVRAVAARMIELMFQAEGIGLAGPQVGLSWRLFVVHVPSTAPDAEEPRSVESDPPTATAKPTVYINPTLSKPEGPLEPMDEGCLSLPDIRGRVLRPELITVTATDLEGRQFTQRAGGLLARCWQHEFDHLEGVLIIDKFSQASRLKNRAKIRDLEHDA